MATSNGLTRYDGYDFERFTKADGLLSNNLTGLSVLSDSTLAILTYNDGLNYYKNGVFHSALIENGTKYLNTLFNINDTLFYYSGISLCKTYNNGQVLAVRQIIEENNSIDYDSIEMPKYGRLIYDVYKTTKNELLVGTTRGLFWYKNNILFRIYNNIINSKEVYSVFSDSDDNIYAAIDNYIIKITNGDITESFYTGFDKSNKVNHILIDNSNRIWFSTVNNGFYLYENGTVRDMGARYGLQGVSVNTFFQDMEGNVWICTQGKGVICFYNGYIKNYTKADGLSSEYIMKLIRVPDYDLMLGTYNGISLINKDNTYNFQTGKTFRTEYVYDIEYNKFDNSVNICSTSDSIFNILKTKFRNINFTYFGATSILTFQDSIWLGGWDNRIRSVRISGNKVELSRWLTILGDDAYSGNKIHKIYKSINDRIWVASQDGLVIFDNNKKIEYSTPEYKEIKCFYEFNNHTFAAGENGILVFNNKDSIPVHINSFKNISLSGLTSITSDNDNGFWIGSKKGLYHYSNGNLTILNHKTGLISDEIQSLIFDAKANSIWAATSEGLAKIDVAKMKQMTLHPSTIINTKVETKSGAAYYPINYFTDNKEEDFLGLFFSCMKLSNNSDYKLQYNLDDNEWIENKGNHIVFSTIPEGKHTLSARYISPEGNYSGLFSMVIKSPIPFLKSPVFYVLLSLLVISTVVFISKIKIKNNNIRNAEKLSLEKRMNELRHQALAAMMNPHFVFNSLNSIQHFLNTRETESANNFLVHFSRLIRKNLDNADKTYIQLSNEIDILENYLSLEKIRFENKLEYRIETHNLDLDSIQIPNMIIQPFVENSIWHGILPTNKQNGKISINISINSLNDLEITIKDNGIGINKSRALKSNSNVGYTSHGMKNVLNRLAILSQDLNIEGECVKITDLSETSNFMGTLVKLTLPLGIYLNKPI